MEGFVVYFLKVVTLQTILFACYWLINRKSNSFQFNRYFLLSALILPLIVPILNIPINIFQREIVSEVSFDPWLYIEQSLPMVTINSGSQISGSLSWWIIIIVCIYFLVAIPSLLKLFYDYYRIHSLEKSSNKQEFTPKGFKLLYVPTKILSFSFFNKIFLSDLFPLNKLEKKTIVTHEEYHLTQKHSIDIILAELVRILCWFNPVIMLIQKNLKETHEYLADRHTLQQHGQQDYASLLRSFKLQEINMTLGSAYSSASIKKRLFMMEQSSTKSATIKMLSLILISFFTAFIFACEDNLDSFEKKDEAIIYRLSDEQLEKEIEMVVKVSINGKKTPQELLQVYVDLQRNEPAYRFYPLVISPDVMGAKDTPPEEFKQKLFRGGMLQVEIPYFKQLTQAQLKSHFTVESIEKHNIKTAYALIRKVNRYDEYVHRIKMNKADNSIHDDFDKKAAFKGGMHALVKFLEDNLEYPDLAKQSGIEDKIALEFVVSKSGGLLYLNIAKEPSTSNEEVSIELQKAAFHAIQSTSGLWQPAEKDGKYVMSKMTLPIEFRLDKKKN